MLVLSETIYNESAASSSKITQKSIHSFIPFEKKKGAKLWIGQGSFDRGWRKTSVHQSLTLIGSIIDAQVKALQSSNVVLLY